MTDRDRITLAERFIQAIQTIDSNGPAGKCAAAYFLVVETADHQTVAAGNSPALAAMDVPYRPSRAAKQGKKSAGNAAWMKSAEGRARMSEIQKKAWAKRKKQAVKSGNGEATSHK